MATIDLFEDFNEEQDAMAGDYDEGEGDDQNRSGSDNDDQNKEKVAPKIKVVRNKRKIPTLNVERMKGPRGIIAMDEYFTNMKFKGKGYEKQDLDEVMLRLQHWAHRLFPKFAFDDSLSAIEKLWKKRELQVHMQRYRLDQLVKDEERIIDDDENDMEPKEGEYVEEPMDEFEKLIDEQIALSRTNVGKSMDTSFGNMSSISGVELNRNISNAMETEATQKESSQINDEIRDRIAENRRKALEILEKKKRQAAEELQKTQEISNVIIDDD